MNSGNILTLYFIGDFAKLDMVCVIVKRNTRVATSLAGGGANCGVVLRLGGMKFALYFYSHFYILSETNIVFQHGSSKPLRSLYKLTLEHLRMCFARVA